MKRLLGTAGLLAAWGLLGIGCGADGEAVSSGSTGSAYYGSTGTAYYGTTGTTNAGTVPTVPPPSTGADAGLPTTGGSFWLQLSADDSTSMASAQIAKLASFSGFRLLRHEFLNYYDPPTGSFEAEDFALRGDPTETIHSGLEAVDTTVEGASGGSITLFHHLQADPVVSETRRPWDITLCVDVSGSMSGEKIEFVRAALLSALARLRQGDRITLVTFSNSASLRFENLEWPASEATIRSQIQSLAADGGTNMIAGLDLAYERAQAHHAVGRLSRVLLFGDGQANVGDTDLARFNEATRIGNEEGVYLSSVGVGSDFDWVRMDQLADAGKGASVFLPNAEEAMRMFATEQFTKLIEIAADEVDVELELPAGLVLADFSGEEVSTDPNQRVPSVVLASGDDLAFQARFEYADEAVLDGPALLRIRLRPLGTGVVVVHEASVPSVRSLLRTGGASFERASIIDGYGQLRAGITGGPTAESLIARIDAIASPDPGLAEIRSLLQP